jgi:hypothetical protein
MHQTLSAAMPTNAAQLDHLVLMATTLAQGVAWCEATLGVTPGPGGEHPLMGTHNRLVSIASERFPGAYLEIIAINSEADEAQRMQCRRWFDMDNEALRARIAQGGPQLTHFVIRVPNIARAVQALSAQGIDRGRAILASRMTAGGLLQWQISVREDGQRLFDGCLPTLIEWGDVHPTHSMAPSGVQLQALHISHPQASALQAAYLSLGFAPSSIGAAPARLEAILQTPLGIVTLHS